MDPSTLRRISHLQSHLIPHDSSSSTIDKNECSSSKCPHNRCSGSPCTCSSCPASSNTSVCPVSGKSGPMVNRFTDNSPLRILVTGAAGNIAYSLVFMIAHGDMFGPKKQIVLHLLDIAPMAQTLKAVEMELADCAFPLLKEVIVTTDVKTAFMHVDVAILVGAFPRQKGMERKDLLKKNAAIFKEHGKAINDFANRDVKVIVVGNPANTNCLIASVSAPNIPRENFTCLTRLDHNRALSQLSQKMKIQVKDIQNVIIWGNHSSTQYPDISYASINNFIPSSSISSNVRSALNENENDQYSTKEFIQSVQQRGAKIIEARKTSSAASAANAVVCHVRDWCLGTKRGEFVSMGVVSDGSYGVPEGLVYSFPVTCAHGRYSIVKGLPLSEFSKKQMKVTENELEDEKKEAFSFLDEKS